MSPRTPRAAATVGLDTLEVVAHLLLGKARLLKFLETRLGNRADAEDILQQALLVLVAKGQSLRRGHSVVAWFHTVLRNLLVDAHRRRVARAKLAARLHAEALVPAEEGDALFAEIWRPDMPTHDDAHFWQRLCKLDEPFELLEFLSASVIFMIEILPPSRGVFPDSLKLSTRQRVNRNFHPGWRDS